MKHSKRLISALLVFILVLSCCPTLMGSLVLHISAVSGTESGTCGENVGWTYDASTSTLRIAVLDPDYRDDYGYFTADIDYYETADSTPWYHLRSEILRVELIDAIDYSLGGRPFAGYQSLREIYVTTSDSYCYIGDTAFENCPNLSVIYGPIFMSSLEEFAIDNGLRYVLNSYSYRLGDNVYGEYDETTGTLTVSGTGDMYNRDIITDQAGIRDLEIRYIKIEEGVTSIGDGVFEGADLIEIELPSTLKYIGDYAFSGDGIVKLELPEGLETLNTGVLSNLPNLKALHIPASLTKCIDYWSGGCELTFGSGVESVTVAPGNPVYYAENNCLILKETKKLCDCVKDADIPSDIKIIGGGSLSERTSKIFRVPESVTTIEVGAFSGYDELETLYIPAGVTTINMYDEYFETYEKWPDIEIIIDPANTAYKMIDNCLVDIRTNEIVQAFDGCAVPDGVTEIPESAFEGVTMTSYDIPESVTTIGDLAFAGQPVKNLHIPASVTSIGYRAFDNTYLESITVDDANTVYGDAGNCLIDWLNGHTLVLGCKNSTIPWGVVTIDTYAFWGCDIEEVSIPGSVEEIPDNAFEDCKYLKELTFAEGVKSISYAAFSGCVLLDTVVFPESLVYISSHAFSGCPIKALHLPANVSVSSYAFDAQYLESITVDPENTSLWAAGNCLIYDNYLNLGCKNSVIPDGVSCISAGAFKNCDITSVVFPDSLRVIQDSAFEGCRFIETITIPDSVIDIYYGVFRNCTSLKSVHIGKNVEQIGGTSFDGCTALESITVSPDNQYYAVVGTKLMRLEDDYVIFDFGQTGGSGDTSDSEHIVVSSLYYEEFENNTTVKTVEILASVEEIPNLAFHGCTSLESVIIRDGVKRIGANAFNGCTSLKSVTIPDSVETIDYRAFQNCKSLTSISLGSGVHTIGEWAFMYCNSLTEVDFGENLFRIGYGAFAMCNIKKLELPDRLFKIGAWAFENNFELEAIHIPENVGYIGFQAFNQTSAVKSITVDSGNEVYSAKNNCLIKTATKTLIRACGNNIPTDGSVTRLGDQSLSDIDGLKKVDIPDCVTYIGDSLLQLSDEITEIYIGSGVTEIGTMIFNDCDALEKITVSPDNGKYYSEGNCIIEKDTKKLIAGCISSVIPDDVKIIGERAFVDVDFETVTLPESVTAIEMRAFYGCEKLTALIVPDTVSYIEIGAFDYCDALTLIGQSDTYIEAYANDYGLKFIALDKMSAGDTNGDETINASDYTILKRSVLGTVGIPEPLFAYYDINKDDIVNASDYTLLKRVVLGTYKIA